jgi:RNA polymerase sigma-70 factor (ECF subfamily)
LRQLAALPPDARLPLMSTEERDRMAAFVAHFRAGEFDAIRAMLAEDVRVELVNRLSLTGKAQAAPYFTRYGAEPKWRYAFGSADGHPAMLVFDHDDTRPAHFVLLDWQDGRISRIRDFLFAPYATEALDWALLG